MNAPVHLEEHLLLFYHALDGSYYCFIINLKFSSENHLHGSYVSTLFLGPPSPPMIKVTSSCTLSDANMLVSVRNLLVPILVQFNKRGSGIGSSSDSKLALWFQFRM